jgi:integrase
MAKSTASRKSRKPSKPCEDFPLFPHATKRWAKKIKGKLWYFGSWADGPQAALDRYLAEKDEIFAGRDPRAAKQEGYTISRLANEFLTRKTHSLRTGTISARHFHDLHGCCERLVQHFGPTRLVETIKPADFEQLQFSFPATWRLRRIKREITSVRSVFRYAVEMDKLPGIKFGAFKNPGKKEIVAESKRNERANGSRVFTPTQLHAILGAASPQLKAMVLLGANAGYGNGDVAALTTNYLDLENGWATFPRPKTSQDRRAKLWPQTIAALREVIANRPKQDSDLVFQRPNGQPWVRVAIEETEGKIAISTVDEVTKAFRRLLKELKIHRKGLSFYSCRHCTETYGGSDAQAKNLVMGHVDGTMAANYTHGIHDSRLVAVANNLHDWLFGEPNSSKAE